jgi:hypothetical protein
MSKTFENDPCEFPAWIRNRAEGHAPGYDIAVYARPAVWIALAGAIEARAAQEWQDISTAPEGEMDAAFKLLKEAESSRTKPIDGNTCREVIAQHIKMREALEDIMKDGPIWRAQRIARETLAALIAEERGTP